MNLRTESLEQIGFRRADTFLQRWLLVHLLLSVEFSSSSPPNAASHVLTVRSWLRVRPATARRSTARTRSVAAVKSYWQQMVFSGRGVPPPELDTEAQVVSFVLRNPGSVGYVSVGTSLHGARTLAVW